MLDATPGIGNVESFNVLEEGYGTQNQPQIHPNRNFCLDIPNYDCGRRIWKIEPKKGSFIGIQNAKQQHQLHFNSSLSITSPAQNQSTIFATMSVNQEVHQSMNKGNKQAKSAETWVSFATQKQLSIMNEIKTTCNTEIIQRK